MIGRKISHYKILEKLGEGGMGVVYKAHDTKLDRTVALKFLPSHIGADDEEKKRFLNEAKAASALDHGNICSIYSIEEDDDGNIFIVMAYYEGRSLKEKLEQGQVPLKDAVQYSIQIATGLQEAHEKGIVHRDLKPANIFITNKDQIKIIDFGLAKAAQRSMLTKSGTKLGTVPYMSPEQAKGNTVDHRTDIWSLGVVMYEMITGQLPFKSEYDTALIYSIVNEYPEPVTGLRSGVPMELERIINKCLDKDSDDRYQHAGELIVDVRKVERELSSGVRSKAVLSDREEVPHTSSADKGSSSGNRPVKQTIKPWAYGIPVILILLLVLYFYLPDSVPPPETEVAEPAGPMETSPESSIAVLPFVNMSPDPENEFFADGISEELLNVLAGLEGLTVASRTSAFLFKDTDASIPEIADQLGVRHVVEGSVRRHADRVRITAQLIDAHDDAHLWSDTYEDDVSDIFRLQEEIAQAITDELEDILGTREVAVEASTGDLDAYDRFLRGRARFHERTELSEAIADLEYAVEHDPEFGEAWLYLAAVNYVAPGYSELSYDDTVPAVRAAVERAGTLVPDHPMVSTLRGQLKRFEDCWVSALQLMSRGAGMRSQHSTPALWYGNVLLYAGYIYEAIIALERAQLVDPLVAINNGILGLAYLAAGRDESAEHHVRLAAERGWIAGMWGFAVELTARGERDRAEEIWAKWITPEGLPEGFKRLLEALRDPAQTEALMEWLDEQLEEPIPIPGLIALGREDVFLAYTREHVDRIRLRGDIWLRMIWQPSFIGVREDPRFFEIARDIGLVKLWEERGYPPGCERASSPEGDHLDCPGMRP